MKEHKIKVIKLKKILIIAIALISLALFLSGCTQIPFELKPSLEVELGKSFSLFQNQTAIIKKNGIEIGRITLTELRQIGEVCRKSNPPQCDGFASINSKGFESQPITFSITSADTDKKELGNYLLEFKFYSPSQPPFVEIKSSGTGPVGVFVVTENLDNIDDSEIPFPDVSDSVDDEPPEVPF